MLSSSNLFQKLLAPTNVLFFPQIRDSLSSLVGNVSLNQGLSFNLDKHRWFSGSNCFLLSYILFSSLSNSIVPLHQVSYISFSQFLTPLATVYFDERALYFSSLKSKTYHITAFIFALYPIFLGVSFHSGSVLNLSQHRNVSI